MLLGEGFPGPSSWPDIPPSSPFTAFLPQPFGIAGGGRVLPPLDFSHYRPPAPPNPRMDAVNSQWNHDYRDPLPEKHTRVGFTGPAGERIPAGAETPPPQPPPTWNGTHNTELSDMVRANYDTVHVERAEQQRFFNDIVANPMSDTETKRRELREELGRIDRDPDSQHLSQAAREDLANLGLSHPHLVDEDWLVPTRPSTPQPPESPVA